MRIKPWLRACAFALLIVVLLAASFFAISPGSEKLDAVQAQVVDDEDDLAARAEGQDRVGLTSPPKSRLSDIIFTLLISVKSISRGCAADNAGLQPGDFIFRIGGVSMRGVQTLRAIETAAPGTVIDVEYGRPDPASNSFTRFHAQVPLGVARSKVRNLQQASEEPTLPFDSEYQDRVLLDGKTPRSSFGVNGRVMMLLTHVEPGSPAEQAGLRPGDLIAEIDGLPVRGIQTLRAAQTRPPGTLVNVVYLRLRTDYETSERATARVALAPLKQK
jgi:membrane-associated protease RseP (regulator of RpoE activity)